MNQDKEEQALIAIKADLRFGLQQASRVLKLLAQDHQVRAVSSMYKVRSYNSSWEDWEQNLVVAVLLNSSCATLDFYDQLRSIEQQQNKEAPRNLFSLYLLLFGENVEVSRHLTLPHPSLHSRAELLMPASEIAADITHPILKKGLKELRVAFRDENWGEFYAQGKSLLEVE